MLTVLLAVLLGSNCFADTILSVPDKIQEHSQWCWAGASQSILAYYKSTQYPSQCRIVNWAWGRTDCCGNTTFSWKSPCNKPNDMFGSDGSLQAILENWGVSSDTVYSSLDKATATAELEAGRPFVMRFGWASGGGHFLNGRGISDNNLYYMDPWPGNGYTISSYDWVVSSSDHTWTHTLQITTAYSRPRVTVAATDDSASEGGADPGKFTVSRAGSSTASDLMVTYSVGGTATGGTDYQKLPLSVTIPAGKTSATILVTPRNDRLAEANECVIVTLVTSTDYTTGFPNSATVTIKDNDSGDRYEPDNKPATAKTIVSGETQYRSIHVLGDGDWVKFTLEQTSDVTIETNGMAGDDTVIALFGPDSPTTLIEKDNNHGAGYFPRIERMGSGALTAGTYYLKVREYGNNKTIFSYILSLDVQPVD